MAKVKLRGGPNFMDQTAEILFNIVKGGIFIRKYNAFLTVDTQVVAKKPSTGPARINPALTIHSRVSANFS